MRFGRIIEPSPGDQPKESQHSGNSECWTPAPPEVDPENKEWRDGSADGRSAVKECRGQCSFTFRKPLRNRLGGCRPVRGLARAQEETEHGETGEAICQRRQCRNNRVPGNGER